MSLDDKLISIIVPVYNVESYIEKCLDSILSQSYKNLEIILVDDGSTDTSGKICDECAQRDNRVKVIHTENRGLSAARNLGLKNITGEYIGFVDGDDWIDQDMYEILLMMAEKTCADIIECGIYEEYPNKTIWREREILGLTGLEAVEALVSQKLSNSVWNKIWKRQCFTYIRFPEDRLFEDILTTYRIFSEAKWVHSIKECKYHYLQRKNGLSRMHSMKNLIDYWMAHYERYTALKNIVRKDSERDLLICCASAAARAWAYFYDCSLEDRISFRIIMSQMNEFMRNQVPLFGCKGWSMFLRMGCIFPHYNNTIALRMAWLLNRIKIKMC